MTFKEISAWIMSAALIAGGWFYFNAVKNASEAAGELATPELGPIIVYVAILIVLSIIGHIIGAGIAGKEANAPADERDRMVTARAGNLSGVAFGIGVMTGLGGYLMNGSGDILFYTVVAALMVSQLIEYLMQIWFYRRGV